MQGLTRKGLNEMFSAYPDIEIAVAYVEGIIDSPDQLRSSEPVSAWGLLMERGFSPPEVVAKVRFLMGSFLTDSVIGKTASEALAQTYSPSFLTYIKGKMGAV